MAVEASLVRRVLREINSWPQTRAIKMHGSIYSLLGTPDILGCTWGRMFAMEGKRPGELARPVQRVQLKLWERAGAEVGVFTSLEEAVEIVQRAQCRRTGKNSY